MTTCIRSPYSATASVSDLTMPWKITSSALLCLCIILSFFLVRQSRQDAAIATAKPVPGPRYDRAYVHLMIASHQKAISEAKLAAREAWHPELIALAKEIAASRQTELDNLLRWSEIWWNESQNNVKERSSSVGQL